jgi:hypothetical protein
MEESDERSFDEQAFWASAALELLGKAALAKASPLLIAEPTEDGANILIATGMIDGEANFRSIAASTVFKRCERVFRPFSEREAKTFAAARNEYLHGARPAFASIPAMAWWPKFWAQASILVTALDRTIEDLVGSDRYESVERQLAQNKQNIKHRVEILVGRAKQRLALHREGRLPAKLEAEWNAQRNLSLGFEYKDQHACPACASMGIIEGTDHIEVERDYDSWDDETGRPWAKLTIPSQYFSCETCRLVLETYELIEEAGLPDVFTLYADWEDYFEPDYGND